MTPLYFPSIISSIINSIGLLTLSFYLVKILFALKVRFVTKQWPKNSQEYKYFLLQEENTRLSKKIESLEQENNEMLASIINQLKG